MKDLGNILLVTAFTFLLTPYANAQPFTSEFGSDTVLTVQSLKRSASDSVVFKGTLENKGTKRSPQFDKLLVGPKSTFAVKLQDPIAKKEYQQVTVDEAPVGSNHSTLDTVEPGEKVNVWARITAPPPDVEKVTVILGGSMPPIEDVPLQK